MIEVANLLVEGILSQKPSEREEAVILLNSAQIMAPRSLAHKVLIATLTDEVVAPRRLIIKN